MNSQSAHFRLCGQEFPETLAHGLALSILAFFVVPAILGGKNLAAQTDAPLATKWTQQTEAARSGQPRRRASTHFGAAAMQSQSAPQVIAAPPPAPPSASVVPANQPLHEARVSWDSRGLEIEAYNSSLSRILHQVLAETRIELQGLAQDQRIFGTYGRGPARDVLSKLLEDSGYNVLMIGGPGTDIPLVIVLSVRPPASPEGAEDNRNRGNPDDDDADPPSESPHPPPMVTPFGNGDSGKPETPQQIMQDILSRQQKIDLQQQQKQQDSPQQ